MADEPDSGAREGASFGIFINYRRRDTVAGHAGRLRDAIKHEFPDAEVFFDVESMPRFMGLRFAQIIDRALGSCDVLLAIIGSEWAAITKERMNDERDWVRREIAAALERDIRVVPLLVEGAAMPEELPKEIADLADFQAYDIRNQTWEPNMKAITDMIRAAQAEKVPVAEPGPEPAPEPKPEPVPVPTPEPAPEPPPQAGVPAALDDEQRLKQAMLDMAAMIPPTKVSESELQSEPVPEPVWAPTSEPTPEPSPRRTLNEILDETGLTYGPLGNALGLLFHAEKAEKVAVAVQDVAHDIVLISAPTSDPSGPQEERWLHNLLRLSLAADYTKAVAKGSDVRLACEIPRATFTSTVAEGLIRGLAHLADSTAEDFTSESGWRALQLGCAEQQGRFLEIDAEQARAEVARLAQQKGVRSESEGAGLRLYLPLAGSESKIVVHASSTVISFAAYFGDLKPSGDKVAYMRRMLELSGTVDVARLVLDSDGDVAFFYEVPEVAPDTLDEVEKQFTVLLIGMAVIHTGG